jgi:hypothetical protein
MPTTLDVAATTDLVLAPAGAGDSVIINAGETAALGRGHLLGADFQAAFKAGTASLDVAGESGLDADQLRLARTVTTALLAKLGKRLTSEFSALDSALRELTAARDVYNRRYQAVRALVESARDLETGAFNLIASADAFVDTDVEDAVVDSADAAVRALEPAEPTEEARAALEAAIAAYQAANAARDAAQAIHVAPWVKLRERLADAHAAFAVLDDVDATQDVGEEISWPNEWPRS